MLKKVAIAGLAVVVGVVVLAWISPTLYDYIVNQIMSAKNNAENSIPLEKRIEMLRDKLKDIDNNKQKLVDSYGVKATAFTETQKEVAKLEAARDAEMARIDDFTKDLSDTTKVSFRLIDSSTNKEKDFSREQVEAQLKEEFKNLKIADATLDSKKELVEARKAAKDAAWNAVSTFNKQRDELSAKLDTMEAELAKVRAREAAAAEKVSDNDMAALNAQIDELNKRIDEKNNAADAATALKGGSIDPLAGQKVDSKDDILKQIRDYKDAKNPAPSSKVAEEK